MKISISLFMSDILPHKKKIYHRIVKSRIFKDKTTDDVFQQLKKYGLDGFELLLPQYSITTNADIQEIKKLAKKYGLPVLSIHQALRFITATKVKEIARLFEIADQLHAKVIVLHINSARKQIFDVNYVQALHELEKKYKILVTFENMEKHVESYFHEHRWHAAKFSDLVEKIGFHITFDVVHLAHSHSNSDILHFFQKNKEKISNVHLSDYRRHLLNGSLRPMRYKHMPLGDGQLPIEEFLSLLLKEDYKGLVTLEVNTDMLGVERSIGLIHKITHPYKLNAT
ncbi:MAG TPA: sugar phosphate isomerase/epimerase family protein [Candidatus Sulfotelmatobacter sp.]|jgi:sugar phosphate isomerase/epimerase|nr:sugar phosphate isomerase/epimerase family protein [Candidatus Sulfotelmatobacter sp.]